MSNTRALDRIYGLVIGGAIGDAMGATAKYISRNAGGTPLVTPYDTQKFGIKPGYWTEPTAIWLNVFMRRDKPLISTGVFCYSDDIPIFQPLMLATATLLQNYGDFNAIMSSISLPTAKLWATIIDTALHDGTKKVILSAETYASFNNMSRLYSPTGDLTLDLVHEILDCFGNSNNYKEGLDIVNTSSNPVWAGALYGQLAGAFYGLTDIDEGWMDCVQMSDVLLEAAECSNKRP